MGDEAGVVSAGDFSMQARRRPPQIAWQPSEEVRNEVVRAAMAWYNAHGRPIEAWDLTGCDLWDACEAWERETR